MRYRNAKHLADGRIDCEIEHPTYGWIPFTCDPSDTGAQFDTAELHSRMASDPATAPYVPPTEEELYATKAAEVRARRDYILQSEVDPIVTNPLRWAEMSADEQTSWVDYRRALLDIPQQSGFPFSVTWPVRQTAPSVFSRDISRW